MLANELRIGNLVHNSHGDIHAIGCNCFHRFRDPSMDGNHSGFKPIPLTEEILLKCGFEYQKDNNSYQLDSDLGFTIWGRVYSGFNVYVHDVEFGETINSLHQLQNLYFSLTQKELEVHL